MRRPSGPRRQEGDRKSLPSQSSPRWRREEVVRTGEGSGTAGEGGLPSPAEPAPDTGSCSLAGGPPGQTPDALSPSAAPRSQPPARLSPPPVCRSPAESGAAWGGRETRQEWVRPENRICRRKRNKDVSALLRLNHYRCKN